MGIIIETLKNGDKATKRYLYGIIAFIISGLLMCAFGAFFSFVLLYIPAGACIISAVIMIVGGKFSKVTSEDGSKTIERIPESSYAKNRNEYTKDGYTKDGYTKDGYTKDEYSKDGYTKEGHTEDDDYPEDRDEYTEEIYLGDVTLNNTSGSREKEYYGEVLLYDEEEPETKSRKHRREEISEPLSQTSVKKGKHVIPEKEETLEKYNRSEVKKIIKKYRIKNYTPVIIDNCKSLALDKVPALCWTKRASMNILVFDVPERVETIPMRDLQRVSYIRNAEERDIRKYENIRQVHELYEMFSDVMPTFGQDSGAGRFGYVKNLYVLGDDLVITPRSLRDLMKKYIFEFRIFDSLNIRGDYSVYFKQAYECRVMWNDNVLSLKQYQERIREILQKMVEDDTILSIEFSEDISKMIQHRLITEEFADYYREKRLERNGRRNR